MRGVENLSKTKKGLTAIGIIMIFGAVIPYYTPDNSISCKLLFKKMLLLIPFQMWSRGSG